MSNNTELKPCPFCGGKNIEIVKGKYFWRGTCCSCGATSPYSHYKKTAIEAWNRRATDGNP